ncbi:MAG TPA: hypothetical protein VF595_05545 [Tepidisphaeraceae bacterium]|jgi:chromosome segregation ATPase
MAEETLLTRVRSWFRKSDVLHGDLPDLSPDGRALSHTPRSSLFHPFAKQNAALESLQNGFGTLTELMSSIRESLEKQSDRQDQLLEHLSRLPAVLEQLPENSRIQGETLKALHQELAAQHSNQQRLTEILDHVSKSSAAQHEALDGLNDRMDRARQTDEQIANNLHSVGTTMHDIGRSTTAGAQMIESLRDNMSSRDNDLQQVLMKQATRFTVMLAVAIFLSIAALVAVAVIGYLLLMKQQTGG